MTKKISYLLGLILIAGISINITTTGSVGNGEIVKICAWDTNDDMRFPGAYVELWDGNDNVIQSGYTTGAGTIHFTDLPMGCCYYLYVDLEDDGTWETNGEEVCLNQPQIVIWNYYPPPKTLLR